MESKLLGDPDGATPEARAALAKANVLRERGNTQAALEAYRAAAAADAHLIPAFLSILELVPAAERELLTPEVREAAARVMVFGTPGQRAQAHELIGEEGAALVAQEVVTTYETSLEINPGDYDARYQLACFFALYGNKDLFVNYLEGLIASFPERIEAYLTLYVHYAGRDEDRAAELRGAIKNVFGAKGLEELRELEEMRDLFSADGDLN